MEEGPAASSDIDLELLRSGIRLMALRALPSDLCFFRTNM